MERLLSQRSVKILSILICVYVFSMWKINYKKLEFGE